jgi:hypothetical protein
MKKKSAVSGLQLSLFDQDSDYQVHFSTQEQVPEIHNEQPDQMIDAPNIKERLEKLLNVAQRTQQEHHQAPRCSTVYSRTKYGNDGTFWHTPSTSEPGGYDVQGNYWCAACKDRIELMNIGESLGYPEISYFPQNPEGMRATMINPGKEEWQRRLPQIWNPDLVRKANVSQQSTPCSFMLPMVANLMVLAALAIWGARSLRHILSCD